MSERQMILIIDFGSQYKEMLARQVREQNVYCEVYPHRITIAEIKEKNPIGIIFTGDMNSVCAGNPPQAPLEIYDLGIPILGICYGMQLMARQLGGHVALSENRDYGKADTQFDPACPLFNGLPEKSVTWMSHAGCVDKIPDGFEGAATAGNTQFAAMYDPTRKFFGMQFHPEVQHTENGGEMLRRFLFEVCGASGSWTMQDYAKTSIETIKRLVGDGRVLLALSGGVDSSVVAALLSEAVGSQLTCIFVDHGLMRKNEGNEVEAAFKDRGLNFIRVNAQDRFLSKLAGVTDPERKRKIIGEEFIRVFEDEAKKLGKVDFLAQGTIYPDIIESGVGDSAVIKSHHNVGGLPDTVDFKELVEPLRLLFKNEVRTLGKTLGLPDYLINRQPFPGPGLGVRVIGEITKEKLDLLRDADAIFREEIANAGLDRSINQYFAVLTNMRSVGVTGDMRTYDYTLALRGVTTTDFMTAEWAKIPWEVLETTSCRIMNEVQHINRVVYDISNKPPATIEWE